MQGEEQSLDFKAGEGKQKYCEEPSARAATPGNAAEKEPVATCCSAAETQAQQHVQRKQRHTKRLHASLHAREALSILLTHRIACMD